jgi:class 3 adenylate cyclase
VLKAILEAEVVHSEAIQIDTPEHPRHLNVSTSFLRDGSGVPIGVIVVLSDVTTEHRRRQLQRLFGEYLDPRIVDRLSQTADHLEHGVRQVATISFLDLEGFMRLRERMKPGQLVRFLNIFLSLMSEPIGKRGGITDKYIGDAILAVWSPIFIDPDRHAAEACQAALEQRGRLDELTRIACEQFDLGPAERIEARIGIATGDVIAGSIGPAGARNYTVAGDTVNLAARLETANKRICTRILAGEETHDAARTDFPFREIGRIPIAGKREPERVFELLGRRGACPQRLHDLVERYEAGLAACTARDFAGARAAFEAALALSPGDGPPGPCWPASTGLRKSRSRAAGWAPRLVRS